MSNYSKIQYIKYEKKLLSNLIVLYCSIYEVLYYGLKESQIYEMTMNC